MTRSHLPDGRCVGWYGDPAVVVDAEVATRPVPPALATRYGATRFWERWTRAEALAKADDVPIAVWLGRHGLPAPEAIRATWTVRVGDVVVSGCVRGAASVLPTAREGCHR